MSATESPIHLLLCSDCSPTVADRASAWARLQDSPPCCQPFFGRRLLRMFPDQHSQQSQLASMVLDMRESLKLNTTKVSESNHAHGQRLAGKSQKPLSLATYARKAFLAQVCAAHRRCGGNPLWHRLSDKELLTPALQERNKQVVPELPDSEVAGAIVARLEGGAELQVHRGEEVPEEEQGRSGHLNPFLVAVNNRLKAAKSIGVKVSADYRKEVMAEVRAVYNTVDGQARMTAEYREYLRTSRRSDTAESEDAPLSSTYMGWGSARTPVPLQSIRSHVSRHGLESSETVWGAEASKQFRVDLEAAAAEWAPKEVTETALPCGASFHNECRSLVLIGKRQHFGNTAGSQEARRCELQAHGRHIRRRSCVQACVKQSRAHVPNKCGDT